MHAPHHTQDEEYGVDDTSSKGARAKRRPLLDELDIDLRHNLVKVKWILLWAWLPRSWVPECVRPRQEECRASMLIDTPDFWGAFAMVVLYALLLLWGQFRVVPWVLLIWSIG